jgi:energy-coupling factor transporter transmembrane protein EcfT
MLEFPGIFIGIFNFIFWQTIMLLCFALIIVMGIVEAFNLSSLMNDKLEQQQQEFLNVKKGAEEAVSRAMVNFVYVSGAALAILLTIMSYKLVKGVEKVKLSENH